MVERMGFEPMKRLTVYTLSKRAHSAALPSFQKKRIIQNYSYINRTEGSSPFNSISILQVYEIIFNIC